MNERFKLSLSGLWLLVGFFSMILPILLPSSVNAPNFAENAVGTATVSMFILSFPASLFGLPVMIFASFALGVDPKSMEGMYLNLFLMFVLGLVQWFWIVPRIFRTEPEFQTLNLPRRKSRVSLSEASPIDDVSFCDAQGRTRLEKVFQEKDSK